MGQSNETRALVPVEQREVTFYDDEVLAVRVQDGRIFVPVRPICDFLGLTFAGQQQRIQRDPVLSEAAEIVSVTLIKSGPGNPNMLALPLEVVPGFLFGISVNRVRDELRAKILRYQRECFAVLWEAFQEGRLTEPETALQLEGQAGGTAAQMALEQARAVYALARAQVRMEARLDAHEQRLEFLEGRVAAPDATVTEEQASQISQAVKAVAMKMSQKTGRNEYGGVYGELYRKFGITSYKLLPARKFEPAMAWLTEWYRSAAGSAEEPPF
jgi:hypothetical protein